VGLWRRFVLAHNARWLLRLGLRLIPICFDLLAMRLVVDHRRWFAM
jgi:hypothetical protein